MEDLDDLFTDQLNDQLDDHLNEQLNDQLNAHLEIANAPSPPPAGLVGRLDELRLSGCTQKLAWSRMGAIAYITSDHRNVKICCLQFKRKEGIWGSTNYTDRSLSELIGRLYRGFDWTHVTWSPHGTDLLIIDSAGRIAVAVVYIALNRLIVTKALNCDPEDNMNAVVGFKWLDLKRRICAPRAAEKSNGAWRYSPLLYETRGPHHPFGKSAFFIVTRGATLKLFHQGASEWQEAKTEIDGVSSSDDLLTHADLCADKDDSLLLAVHAASRQLRLYTVKIDWQVPKTGEQTNNPAVLSLHHLTVLDICSPLVGADILGDGVTEQGRELQMSHLKLLPHPPDVQRDGSMVPTVLAVFSHFSGIVTDSSSCFSVFSRWELREEKPTVDASFAQLSTKKLTTSEFKGEHTFSRLGDIRVGRVPVYLKELHAGTSYVFGYSDGDVEFRDRSMSLQPIENKPDRAFTLASMGFSFDKLEPCLHMVLSPHGTAKATFGKVHECKISYLSLPLELAAPDTMDRVTASFVLQHTMSETSNNMGNNPTDDLLMTMWHFGQQYPENQRKHMEINFMKDLYRTLGISERFTDGNMDRLIRFTPLGRALSMQGALGYQRTRSTRWSLTSKVAFTLQSLRLIALSLSFALLPRSSQAPNAELEINKPENLSYITTQIGWMINLVDYTLDQLFEINRQFGDAVQLDVNTLLDKASESYYPCLILILCSVTRNYIRFNCRGLRNIPPLFQSPAAAPSSPLAPHYSVLSATMRSCIIPPSQLELILEEAEQALQDVYGPLTEAQRLELEMCLLAAGEIPPILAPVLQKLLSGTVEQARQRAGDSEAELAFKDWSRVSLGKDSEEGSSHKAGVVFDAVRKVELKKGKILLVPITEVLLTNKDSESDTLLTDLVTTEDFIGSHVLKVTNTVEGVKENGNVRENRSKAKQYTTLNGKTVVVKESFVYSNKGFRSLTQAQLLSDALYYNDSLDAPQWLVYYISRPLVGTLEPIQVTIATLPVLRSDSSHTPQTSPQPRAEPAAAVHTPNKRKVSTFGDVLTQFPMITRQMQPGLDRIFRDFNKDIEKPLPAGPRSSASTRSRSSSTSSHSNMNGSIRSGTSRKHAKRISIARTSAFADDEENHMRSVLESAVNAAIDNFQLVDKSQLSLLGASTELTGPAVERLIERYIAEHVNDDVLFPRLSTIHQSDDNDLESRIYHMMNIDVAQVGIDIEGGSAGKRRFTSRLNAAIEEFRKLGTASCPQQMLDILLETQRILTGKAVEEGGAEDTRKISEKASMPMNADTLVSLLLLVVIRSQVRHLQARLAYMRNFVFIDDVESGELGYALSTFEAVLQYIVTDAGGLKTASRRNKRLWQATKKGNLSEMRTILEPDNDSISDESDTMIGCDRLTDEPERVNGVNEVHLNGIHNQGPPSDQLSQTLVENGSRPQSDNLSHVFPFQVDGEEQVPPQRPKAVKRVSLDLRSLSGASEYSFRSRTSTMNSRSSVIETIEGDTSIEKLCQTEDPSGDSVLMMAVEAQQPESLAYLLSLEEYYTPSSVLGDANAKGTTLLSAAVQGGRSDIVNVLVDYVFTLRDVKQVKTYLSKQDDMGRTFAHYLFHAPHLIPRLGAALPWRTKDKNGVTPLLALCRSYDHAHYLEMVNQALQYAVDEQGDGQTLHIDYHVDSKGNTLLHAVSDPYLALRILQHCDVDPNAANHKLFTPLMMASKYGRFDLVRTMILDKRVDFQAKEYRGMTAVELAKDDDVRNRIDDMMLVSNVPAPDGRVTAIVRSFFVEDGTVRMVIKTATKSGDGMIAVTTSRRSVADFEHLAKWLSVEHPASWMPSLFGFRFPFQIPSKPSRAVLHDTQARLNMFLKIMLTHSTFATHELLWEFILMPEIQPDMMAERSLKKSEIRQENIREDYSPVEDVRDVELFVTHARESVRPVNQVMKSVIRRITGVRNASRDMYTALDLVCRPLLALAFLPRSHSVAFTTYTRALLPAASDPFSGAHASMLSIHSTILSILSSLSRPHALISNLQMAQKALDRHRQAFQKSQSSSGQRLTSGGWPSAIPAIAGRLLEDSRKSAAAEAKERMQRAAEEVRATGCELSYTYQTVAGELAGWQELHGKLVLQSVRELARGMVIREKGRLEAMRRALRVIKEANRVEGGS